MKKEQPIEVWYSAYADEIFLHHPDKAVFEYKFKKEKKIRVEFVVMRDWKKNESSIYLGKL